MMDNLDTLDTRDTGQPTDAGARLSTDAGLAVDEAAAHAGVSDRTIRRALKARPGDAGYLPSWRVKGPRGSEYRIDVRVLDEWMGRRDALDADDGQPSTLDSQASLARGASLADTSVQSAAVQAIVEQFVAPLVDHLDRTQRELGVVREELGWERAQRHAAEREADALRRARRRMPWWVRLLIGGRS